MHLADKEAGWTKRNKSGIISVGRGGAGMDGRFRWEEGDRSGRRSTGREIWVFGGRRVSCFIGG